MAIQVKLDFHGFELPKAYVRLDRLSGGKDQGWSGVATAYKDKEAFEEGKPPLMELLLPIPPLKVAVELPNGIIAKPGDAINIDPPNADPYAVLYARLKEKCPDAIDV